MRKTLAVLLCVIVVLCGAMASGCRESEQDPQDKSKTQLYVSTYVGGFGAEWLKKAAVRFEQKYAETSFEEGKKGVQIRIDETQSSGSGFVDALSTKNQEVYFQEQVYYQDPAAQGVFLDITDIVEENLTEKFGENTSIAKKLTAEQDEYFNLNGKYYALPHYGGYFGITYDIDLFEEEKLYFKKGGGFITSLKDDFAAGPDGVEGTFDDGLPATYDEMFELCSRISKKSMTPFTWSGNSRNGYTVSLINALVADYEGLDNMMLNFTLDGMADDLVDSYTSASDGKITEMNMVKPAKKIDSSTGYEIYRQAGRAYALSFLERILKNNYYHRDATNEAVSHVETQYTFLESKLKGNAIAMLIDGNFWENEATDSFSKLESVYSVSKSERRFGFMPYPKATAGEDGQLTLFDYLYGVAFISAKIAPAKIPLAKLFLQFCYSDESLVEFTLTTNTPKAMQYDIPAELVEANMTEYGRMVWKAQASADIVYPYSQNNVVRNDPASFNMIYTWKSKLGKDVKAYPFDAFNKENITAKEYFTGLTDYYKTNWSILFGQWY